MADVAQLLGKSQLFEPLPPAARQRVAKQMRPASFGAGQAIFSRGDEGNEVYLVLQGRVRLSVLSVEGRELSFTHAGPGDIFGEIAALDGGPRTADATAVTDVEAMTLSRAELKRLLETVPELASGVTSLLCNRIRNADLQLEGVALHSIEVRLSRFLLGTLEHQDTRARGPHPTVKLGMSQGELALLLGASRPKVNAALVMLEESGAITREGDRVTCNVEELNRIAEAG